MEIITDGEYEPMAHEDKLKQKADRYNAAKYEPPADPEIASQEVFRLEKHFAEIIDCGICGNKSEIAFIKDGLYKQKPCECRVKRQNILRLENSGLMDLVEWCTFEKYEAESEFQQGIKQSAVNFLDCADAEVRRKWFFIGGQVGSGKTHICTAIVKGLIDKNYPAKYMMYRDEAVFLKSAVNKEPEEYKNRVELLKSVEVLYIDDLFKTKQNEMPTSGDVNLVFEIINARYNNNSAITIISSEKVLDEIIAVDEGTGSRIRDRSRGFISNIRRDTSKNWRLRA